jgi:hypothetical protein
VKTLKQISDTLGIDKQRVYRPIVRNKIKETCRKSNTLYYDEEVEILIRDHFYADDKDEDRQQTIVLDERIDAATVIGMLQKELDVKNKQIEELTASLRTAQALHAGTIEIEKHFAIGRAHLDACARSSGGFFRRIYMKWVRRRYK